MDRDCLWPALCLTMSDFLKVCVVFLLVMLLLCCLWHASNYANSYTVIEGLIEASLCHYSRHGWEHDRRLWITLRGCICCGILSMPEIRGWSDLNSIWWCVQCCSNCPGIWKKPGENRALIDGWSMVYFTRTLLVLLPWRRIKMPFSGLATRMPCRL